VREYTDFPRHEQPLREATVLWRNVERVWRTKDEEALGRDFTDEEAAEYNRQINLKVAASLERAAEDVRRAAEQSEHYGLASAVSRVQHDLAWLFPNLGADTLTTSLVEYLHMEVEVKRLGGASEKAES
jgi:hypothetical protein